MSEGRSNIQLTLYDRVCVCVCVRASIVCDTIQTINDKRIEAIINSVISFSVFLFLICSTWSVSRFSSFPPIYLLLYLSMIFDYETKLLTFSLKFSVIHSTLHKIYLIKQAAESVRQI